MQAFIISVECQQFFMTATFNNLTFVNNEVATLATAAEVTTGLVLVGADYAKIENNYFFGAMAAILMIFFSVYFSWSQKHEYYKKDTAIVMKPVSTVKSSPDNSGNTLFILHEGTKVSLIEEIGQWKRVELTDGRQGWINSLDIEVI